MTTQPQPGRTMKRRPRSVSPNFTITTTTDAVPHLPHPERLGHGGGMTNTPTRHIEPPADSYSTIRQRIKSALITAFITLAFVAFGALLIAGWQQLRLIP